MNGISSTSNSSAILKHKDIDMNCFVLISPLFISKTDIFRRHLLVKQPVFRHKKKRKYTVLINFQNFYEFIQNIYSKNVYE